MFGSERFLLSSKEFAFFPVGSSGFSRCREALTQWLLLMGQHYIHFFVSLMEGLSSDKEKI